MKVIYLSFILILFVAFFIADYIKRISLDNVTDKKSLYALSLGIFLIIVFMIGSILDFNGYIRIIEYIFPMWGIAPTIYFFGVKRLLELELIKNPSDMAKKKTLNLYKKLL